MQLHIGPRPQRHNDPCSLQSRDKQYRTLPGSTGPVLCRQERGAYHVGGHVGGPIVEEDGRVDLEGGLLLASEHLRDARNGLAGLREHLHDRLVRALRARRAPYSAGRLISKLPAGLAPATIAQGGTG